MVIPGSRFGLQVSLTVLLVSFAAIAVFGASRAATDSAAQDEIAAPANKDAMEKFMARKLAAAQRTLAGVAREDFELIRTTTTEMIERPGIVNSRVAAANVKGSANAANRAKRKGLTLPRIASDATRLHSSG